MCICVYVYKYMYDDKDKCLYILVYIIYYVICILSKAQRCYTPHTVYGAFLLGQRLQQCDKLLLLFCGCVMSGCVCSAVCSLCSETQGAVCV